MLELGVSQSSSPVYRDFTDKEDLLTFLKLLTKHLAVLDEQMGVTGFVVSENAGNGNYEVYSVETKDRHTLEEEREQRNRELREEMERYLRGGSSTPAFDPLGIPSSSMKCLGCRWR